MPVTPRRLRARTSASRQGASWRALPRNPFWYAFVATLGVGAAVAVLAAVGALSTVILYVGLALFLALAVEPLVLAATRRGVRRWVAVVILSSVFASLIVVFATVVVPTASAQVVALGVRLYEAVEALPDQAWFAWLSATVSESIDLNALLGNVRAFLGDPNQLFAIGGGLLRVGTGIIDVITGLLAITALTVYFTLALPAITTKAYLLVNHRYRRGVVEITDEILQSVGRYVGGQLLLALISATVTLVLTMWIGAPAPAVLALVAFVGSLIPVVGPVIAAGVTALVSLTVSPAAAITAAVVLVVYMQFEAYVLTPRIMSRAVAVPGALVIIAALGGAALGGVLGAFLAVPVAAAAVTVVERVVIPRQQGRAITSGAPKRDKA